MRPLLACLFLFPITGFAQDGEPIPRQNPPRRSAVPSQLPVPDRAPHRPRIVPDARDSATSDLNSNVTLSFQGSLFGSVEIDVDLTGCGPQFVADFPGPTSKDDDIPDPILTISAVVKEVPGEFRVEYSLGARVAIPTSTESAAGARVVRNIQYRDMVIKGAAILKPGEPVTLSKVNGKILTLTMAFAK